MENGVNCDGKSWKSHGILLSDFCGNPVYNVRVGTIYRCINISRYLSRDSYLGNNFDLKKKKKKIFAAGLGHCLKLCAFWRSGAGLMQRHAPDESLIVII